MCNKEYNGYTNYETWCVSLWIDNELLWYQDINNLALECWGNAEDSNDYGFFRSRQDNAIQDLEKNIKDYIEENNQLISEASLYSDMLGSAFDNVNWQEIAENWIETIKEEM